MGYLVGYHGIYGITTNPDTSIDLLDYQGTAQIRDLGRISNVGETTMGQILCEPVSMQCTEGDMVQAFFTLDALEPIN